MSRSSNAIIGPSRATLQRAAATIDKSHATAEAAGATDEPSHATGEPSGATGESANATTGLSGGGEHRQTPLEREEHGFSHTQRPHDERRPHRGGALLLIHPGLGHGPRSAGRRVEQLLDAVGVSRFVVQHVLDADKHAEYARELFDDGRCDLHDRPGRHAHADVLHHRCLHEQHAGHDAHAVEYAERYAVEQRPKFRIVGDEQFRRW